MSCATQKMMFQLIAVIKNWFDNTLKLTSSKTKQITYITFRIKIILIINNTNKTIVHEYERDSDNKINCSCLEIKLKNVKYLDLM